MACFIGEGVLKLKNGEFLNYGEPIPKDLPKETVAYLKKNGAIGEVPTLASAKVNSENESLRKKINELQDQLKDVILAKDKAEAKISENKSEKKVKELEKENAVLALRVEELKKLIDEIAADSEGGAKPKKGFFGGVGR